VLLSPLQLLMLMYNAIQPTHAHSRQMLRIRWSSGFQSRVQTRKPASSTQGVNRYCEGESAIHYRESLEQERASAERDIVAEKMRFCGHPPSHTSHSSHSCD
jgi:hypothetical protein